MEIIVNLALKYEPLVHDDARSAPRVLEGGQIGDRRDALANHLREGHLVAVPHPGGLPQGGGPPADVQGLRVPLGCRIPRSHRRIYPARTERRSGDLRKAERGIEPHSKDDRCPEVDEATEGAREADVRDNLGLDAVFEYPVSERREQVWTVSAAVEAAEFLLSAAAIEDVLLRAAAAAAAIEAWRFLPTANETCCEFLPAAGKACRNFESTAETCCVVPTAATVQESQQPVEFIFRE